MKSLRLMNSTESKIEQRILFRREKMVLHILVIQYSINCIELA